MIRLTCAFLFLLACCNCSAIGKTVVEWTFDRAGDLRGWLPNAHFKSVVVTNGVLRCRAVGRDPIFELQSKLKFPASARQVVEIRLKADADGVAQWFYSRATTGPYGGFAEEKSLRFRVNGDGVWRTYRLLPGWHPEGEIVRLRFDLYDATRFELDSIRIVELATLAPAPNADFDFQKSGRGWQWIETVTTREPERRSVTGFGHDGDSNPAASRRSDAGKPIDWNGNRLRCDSAGLLLSPPLHIDADQHTLATFRMAVNRGTYGALFFIRWDGAGLHRVMFPVIADGREHTYHLDLLANTNWSGRIIGLGLQPSDAANTTVNLRSLKVEAANQTPPRLSVSFFDAEDAQPRAGVPTRLLAVVRNTGGRTASNLVAKLDLPSGVKLLANASLEQTCDRLGLGDEARFAWTAQADRPVNGKFRLTLSAVNAEAMITTKTVRLTPRAFATNTTGVPEPKPVRPAAGFEVGAYYFPGWPTADRWRWIQRFPERRPVPGWYREGDPEVADWHIKWAVEHGITFFAYDWYWTQGRRHLEHGLHDGFFKARYRHLLKFCLLWANHNPPGTSSHEDCIAVTRYWIENYFRRPEHLTCDGKPVVIIYQPERLTDDLGSANVKIALDAMREECRRAGLKGLYITTCVGDAGIAKIAASEGYDAITAYTWPGSGMTGDGMFAPFETLVPAYRRKWEHLLAESPLPQMPLLVCGGWDSRPWHGDNGLVRFGRTPELFKRHLLDAKQFLETANPKSGLPKMILIEAWNEWGEGSYIEPHQEFGFGYLDAIREVFTAAPRKHVDVTPGDVGLGPYDLAALPLANPNWSFETGDEGWTAGRQLSDFMAGNGQLNAITTGGGSLFISPMIQTRADEFRELQVRMRLARGDGSSSPDTARISWRSGQMVLHESRGMEFPVRADGQWREYRVPLAQNPQWRGTMVQLFMSPCRQPNVRAELDFVRLAD